MFQNGQLRLFRLFGVTVWLSWTILLLIPIEMYRQNDAARNGGDGRTLSIHILEYVCMFLIVLLHEFGHALACKSVGGRAERIVLRLLGGVAYVQPPQRPGALLWSIAAGPLVNVILVPVTLIPALVLGVMHMHGGNLEMGFLGDLAAINIILLVFNMLPIYPLDGGQILMALLWFIVGRGTSLIIVAVIGIIGAVGLLGLAAFTSSLWFALLAFFIGSQAARGIALGMRFRSMEAGPRHEEPTCPACGAHPPTGNYWTCPCGAQFDTFATQGQCPRCGRAFDGTSCPFCGQLSPLRYWYSTGGFPVVNVAASPAWGSPPQPPVQPPPPPPPVDSPFP